MRQACRASRLPTCRRQRQKDFEAAVRADDPLAMLGDSFTDFMKGELGHRYIPGVHGGVGGTRSPFSFPAPKVLDPDQSRPQRGPRILPSDAEGACDATGI